MVWCRSRQNRSCFSSLTSGSACTSLLYPGTELLLLRIVVGSPKLQADFSWVLARSECLRLQVGMPASPPCCPVLKGRVEARPCNPWVHRHEDTPVAGPRWPCSRGGEQGTTGFPRDCRHFFFSIREHGENDTGWVQRRLFVLEYSQQMVFGKQWSNIKQGLPKHLSKCSGWSLAAVRLDHTGEQSQTFFVIVGFVPELTKLGLKHPPTR